MSESMERPPRPPLLDENDRPGPPPIMSEEPRRSSRGLTLFIALFALVAFGGIVWYAYDQGRQTGSEETAPLIRADSAPVRVRPDKPGGLEVPHQDKLIFDKLAEGGNESERPVERLLPRPEEPTKPPPPPAASPPPTPQTQTQTAEIPPAKAPEAAPAAGAETGTPRGPAPPPAVQPPQVQPKVIPPAPKPAAAPSPPAPKPAAEPKAASVGPVSGGAYRVQIAAFKDEPTAREAWTRAQKTHPADLGALSLTIEQVDVSGKGIFHRVQGGPLDEAAARGICRTLESRKQACIVVKR